MTLEKQYELKTPGAAVAVAWSFDGTHLAAASNFGGDLTVWGPAGNVVSQFKRIGGGPALSGSLEFTHGNSQLVFAPPASAGSDVALTIWNVTDGSIAFSINGPEIGRDYAFNRGQIFLMSPNGRTLFISTIDSSGPPEFPSNVIIYDVDDWAPLAVSKIRGGVDAASFFDNGRLVAVATIDGKIAVLDATSGTVLREFPAYARSKYGFLSLGTIAASPDGQFILVGADQLSINAGFNGDIEAQRWQNSIEPLLLFKANDGMIVSSLKNAAFPIRRSQWSPDGRYVVFIDNDDGLFIWCKPYSESSYTKINVNQLSLSFAIAPDGKHIAVTTANGITVFRII